MQRRILITLATLASLFALIASPSQALLRFTASADLASPSNGATIHTGGILHTTNVPVGSWHHSVSITGASTNQSFQVQWTMDVELDMNFDNASKDWDNKTISCNIFGNWDHQANGNGQCNGSFNSKPPATYTATAYCDFYDTVNFANRDNHHDDHSVTVVDP